MKSYIKYQTDEMDDTELEITDLFIACYRNFNYEPMQRTKLYLKKSVAYCILLENFTAERRL